MKKILRKALRSLGLEIRRVQSYAERSPAGSERRPIGNIEMFLKDIRARGFQPRGILDIGANRGNWSTMAAAIFPEAKIVMIEPQAEMKPCLEELCSGNKSMELIPAAAGSECGQLVQTIWPDLAGSSFLPEVRDDKLATGEQRLTQVVTINSVLEQRSDFSPDLVKLDIQGFELEALRGGSLLFGKTEIFILETSLYEFLPNQPTTLDCCRFMSEKGYSLYDVTGFLRRPYDGGLGQIDLAFAKTEGSMRKSTEWAQK